MILISEKLPLRGCLNPDAQTYVVSYISSRGVKQIYFFKLDNTVETG